MNERQAHALVRIAREVLSELDLEEVLRRLVQAGRTLTGAEYAAVGILNESEDGLARFETLGLDEETHRQIGELPKGRGVLGELIRNPHPLRLADVSSHPRSYGFPAAHPRMSSFLGVPIVIDGVVFGNLYLAEKGDAPFDEDDEEAVVVLAELAAIAVRNARRYTGTRGREVDLEQTVAALEATTEISRALGSTTDLDVVLELIGKRGRALVAARTLVIAVPERGGLVVAGCAGENQPQLEGLRYGKAGTVEEQVMQSGSPERWSSELQSARQGQSEFADAGVSAAAGLVVPLRFADRSIGALVALDRVVDGPAFSSEDERLLEAFAFTAATAIATARRVASERRGQRLAAAEEERRRWARELHDETLQGLAALRIMLSSARRSESRADVDAAVERAVADLATEIENLRTLISELRPAALDQLGTGVAVTALVDRVARDGLEVDLHVDLAWESGRTASRHSPELEASVYRTVQEALTNVVKHAGAARASVTITEGDDDVVEVRVSDDGCGFDPSATSAGFGLLGMSERVDLLDGEMHVDSAAGDGTTVTVRIPVVRAAEPASPPAVRSAESP